MRSYLSLISISTKVRKKQSRMTVLCIVIAVFLVTVVFSMTDMLMRAELSHQVDKNGSWHLMFEDISDLTASDIASRLDVAAAGWSSKYSRKIRFTTFASFLSTIRFPFTSFVYPRKCSWFTTTVPFWYRNCSPNFTFCDKDADSCHCRRLKRQKRI